MIRQEKKHETTPFSFLACLEVARLVRLARLARVARLVSLGWLGYDRLVRWV